ncbi:unnamed protein product [Darwinula stevensoni]|uniref:Protein GAMETE EXPRESSED 1 n=1 Tax=Darwinula stevensoni TaxID=69355 RepID=A0A7R8X815_9CRUS|nr:unnamed protein product [Darwinula stevensoni]CAG0882914.1 unnamed protein product [Darwinula stevensoni]
MGPHLKCPAMVLLLAGLGPFFTESVAQLDHKLDELAVEEGRREYTSLIEETKYPRYGACWLEAIEYLHEGCRTLTDESQSRVALKFANCFLLKTGQIVYPCEDDQEIRDCTQHMSDKAYATFNNFFTHTRSLCQFLQSQKWQTMTEDVISRLSLTSAEVSHRVSETNERLKQSNELQGELLNKQKEAFQSLSKLHEEEERMQQHMQMFVIGFKEFRWQTSDEQRSIVLSLLDRLTKLQNFVLGEVSTFSTIVYYITAFVLCFFLTSTPRTAAARFWLYLILTGNAFLELSLSSYIIERGGDMGLDAQMVSDSRHYRVWLLRKAMLTVCSVVLGTLAYKFKDLNAVNHQLIRELYKQNEEIKKHLSSYISLVTAKPVEHGAAFRQQANRDWTDAVCGTDDSRDLDSDSDDSEAESDLTYYPAAIGWKDDNDSDDASYISEIDAEELSSIKANSSMPEEKDEADHPDISVVSKSPRRLKQTPKSTPCQRYNLRERRKDIDYSSNSSLAQESPGKFYHLIKQMEKRTQKTSSLLRQALMNQTLENAILSDED